MENRLCARSGRKGMCDVWKGTVVYEGCAEREPVYWFRSTGARLRLNEARSTTASHEHGGNGADFARRSYHQAADEHNEGLVR